MSDDQELIRARALVLGFGRTPILPPLDLGVRRRQIWGIIGRNGAGKTTFFRTLLGLHPAVSGSVVSAPGVTIGYVPQRHAFDPLVPARARDLIAEGSERGRSFLRPFRSADEKARIARAIDATQTADLLSKRYRDLSEGQKQRVLLARALAGGSDLLVLDEPTSAMDVVAEREVANVMLGLRDKIGIGILLVSHNLGLVASIADRLLFLDADDGVTAAGSVDEVLADPVFARRYGAVLAEPRHPLTSRPPPAGATGAASAQGGA